MYEIVANEGIKTGGDMTPWTALPSKPLCLQEDEGPSRLRRLLTNSQPITKTTSLTIITITLHETTTLIRRIIGFTSTVRLERTPIRNLVILQRNVKALNNLSTLRNR